MVWRLISIVMTAAALQAANGENTPGLPAPIQYGPARQLAKLANREITESSGVACSRAADGVFWTHNDSGDRARVFAFDAEGKHLGTFAVPGARALDWEDMASVRRGGKNLLLLADIGDNKRKRSSYALYLVEEPSFNAGRANRRAVDSRARLVQTIRFRYEDGANDCESVAVDPVRGRVILVSKRGGGRCTVYRLAWPHGPVDQPGDEPVVAKAIARLAIPTATAMDISPDGLRAVVLTYGDAYEYRRRPGEDWAAGFSRAARRLRMPPRAQGESICYGRDGATLYLTSEKVPCPLWQVAPKVTSDRTSE